MRTEKACANSDHTLHVSVLPSPSPNSSEFRVWEILVGKCLVGQRAFILSLSVEPPDHQMISKSQRDVFFLKLDLDLFEVL